MIDAIGQELATDDYIFSDGKIYKVTKICQKMVRCLCIAQSTANGWKKIDPVRERAWSSKEKSWILKGSFQTKIIYPHEMIKLQEETVVLNVLGSF